MKPSGTAQLDLIRRYAKTLRELHADAMRAQGPRIGARARREREAVPPVETAQAVAADRAAGRPPGLPAT